MDLKTYIVSVDFSTECRVDEYRIRAADPTAAAFQAGLAASFDVDIHRDGLLGILDTIKIVAIHQVTETRKQVWA